MTYDEFKAALHPLLHQEFSPHYLSHVERVVSAFAYSYNAVYPDTVSYETKSITTKWKCGEWQFEIVFINESRDMKLRLYHVPSMAAESLTESLETNILLVIKRLYGSLQDRIHPSRIKPKPKSSPTKPEPVGDHYTNRDYYV